MVKIALIKFNSNLAYGLWGWKRQNFKKWDKVIVQKDEVLRLLRLWCTLEWEVELTYKEYKTLFKKWKETAETEKVEAPAETTEVEPETDVETEKVEAPAETDVVDETTETN